MCVTILGAAPSNGAMNSIAFDGKTRAYGEKTWRKTEQWRCYTGSQSFAKPLGS
jgi:hypothetical protein